MKANPNECCFILVSLLQLVIPIKLNQEKKWKRYQKIQSSGTMECSITKKIKAVKVYVSKSE